MAGNSAYPFTPSSIYTVTVCDIYKQLFIPIFFNVF
jgi:hypothetical protein